MITTTKITFFFSIYYKIIIHANKYSIRYPNSKLQIGTYLNNFYVGLLKITRLVVNLKF